MKAWLLDHLGDGVDGLRIGTVMDPSPEQGEVVLEIDYAALNPADRYLAENQYPAKPSLPHILGRDGIGRVVAIGAGVSGVGMGEQRLILRSETGVSRAGTFAERVAVPVESLVEPPKGWSNAESAAAPLVYLTAWQALTMWGDLPPSVVLVTGASGGVGVACLHLATALGHTVVALSRSQVKRDELQTLGAQYTLDPNDSAWPKSLKTLLGRRRVDLAVDNIGGKLLPQVIETLADHGRVSCVGALAGPVPQFNTATLFFRRVRLGGVNVGSYKPSESREAWKQIVQTLDRSGRKPLVDSTFPFSELPAAFKKLRAGPMGKVLLEVQSAEA